MQSLVHAYRGPSRQDANVWDADGSVDYKAL